LVGNNITEKDDHWRNSNWSFKPPERFGFSQHINLHKQSQELPGVASRAKIYSTDWRQGQCHLANRPSLKHDGKGNNHD
jgi:hypothetical protein